MVLICISLMTNDAEHFSVCLLAIYIFWRNFYSNTLLIFLSYLSFWVARSVYMSWLQVLCWIHDLQIFSLSLWVIFSLSYIFWSAQVLNFDEVQFINFLYCLCIYLGEKNTKIGVLSKKLLPSSRSWRYTPVFSSKSFLVLAYIWVYNQFWLHFCEWHEVEIHVPSSVGRYPLFQQHSLKRLLFHCCLETFVKINWPQI